MGARNGSKICSKIWPQMTNWIIVVAGGRGQRMGLGFNKIFAKIGKYPVIYWTLAAFEKSKTIDKIVISASKSDISDIAKLIKKYGFAKVSNIIPSSESRQSSTLDVLAAVSFKKADLVGVHNGVNPFVTDSELKEVFSNAKRYGAALLAQKARDTVKITNGDGRVVNTPIRQYVWYAQTPQVATFGNLLKAHEKARKDKFSGTDDAQLLERIGIRPKIVECSSKNFKITFREDLIMANFILKSWGR